MTSATLPNLPLPRPLLGVFDSWSARDWEADSWETLAEADMILVLPFGSHKPKGGKPGESNKLLAALAEQHQKDLLRSHDRQVPVYTQWEIEIPAANYIGEPGDVTTTMEFLEKLMDVYPPELGMKVILYAHPNHFPRARGYLRKLRFKVVMPPGLRHIPWDKESTQWWTRGAIRWIFREIPARIVSFLCGWV